MPIPEDRFYKPEKLNLWFAASSLIMTVSILWMIHNDYSRPWHAFQDDYFVGKAAMARLDYLDAIREERLKEIATARRRLKDAEEFLAQTAEAQRAALAEQLARADLEFRKADAPWSRASQVLEVTRDNYERILGKHGPDDDLTVIAHRRLLEEEELVDRLRKEKEKWEDGKKQLEREIRELDAPVRAARKRMQELEEVAEAALAKDRMFRGVLTDEGLLGGVPLVSTIVNLPLLDFASPKNTPGRYQVNQLVIPGVRQQLNYLETYTTDRCTTCHVAIDDPEFSKDRLARKLERTLPGINEALQSLGREPFEFPPPPVLEDDSDAALPVGRVTDHWGELTREQQDVYFDQLLELVNTYLKLDGRKTIDLRQPILAHPDLELYVSVDSPHPMAKVGCTVCHDGNPQETDFVLAAHTPPTHEIEQDWEEKYYIRHLGVVSADFDSVAHYWDRPMFLRHHTEAGCAKCHDRITDIGRFRGQRKGAGISLGRYLFTNVGCVNCHNVDSLAGSRRVGPDLTYVAAKLEPAFLQQWVLTPQAFRPSTRMPHYYQQENNRAASANKFDRRPVLRTQTEVAGISKYLFAVSQEWQPIQKPQDVVGDVERGRKLFGQVGCLGCHANIANVGEKWITGDLVHRLGIEEETALHRYKGMTYEERIRYAMENFVNERDTFLNPQKARFNGEEDYQTPTLTRYAPELSGIGSKVNFDWLYSWLIDPVHYSPQARMPSLRLSESEAADIAAYLLTLENNRFDQHEIEMNAARRQMVDDLVFALLSALRSERRSRAVMRDEGGELTDVLVSLLESSLGRQQAYDLIQPMSLEDKKLMFLGNKMIGHYGCYACHKIAGFETATEPGTDLSEWAAKPVAQLDFAFYDHAFHDMRKEKEETFGYIYPRGAGELNRRSPLDDLMREEITHTHAAFAKHKLLNPRIWDREKIKRPYDKLKMPNFYFTEEEADALTTFLMSRVSPRVHDTLKIDYEGSLSGPIADGRNLTRELNCIGCHQIEDNIPTIHQFFKRKIGGKELFDSINAPPSLWGEGAKLQHQWFHRFLQQVVPLRPWLQVRMPSFQLTGEEATTLVEYFAALSQQDASQLAQWLAPVEAYIERERTRTTDTSTSAGADHPGADWGERTQLRPFAKEMERWAIERKLMREPALDPLVSSPDRLRRAHAKLLERIRTMQEVYDVPYPFVEPPQPLSSKERFELGKSFFNNMGCLKCHVLGRMLPGPAKNTDDFVQMYRLDGVRGEGDEAVAILNGRPYPVGSTIDKHTLVSASNTYYETGDVETKAVIEGPSAGGETERIILQSPSAPNLTLTHQRLRRGWLYHWMLVPGWIQPGTKMPQNFPEGVSPFEGDEMYPGTGQDHINLLVDFLYDAGTTGERAPLVKIIAVEETEDFDEFEDFDEEEFDDD